MSEEHGDEEGNDNVRRTVIKAGLGLGAAAAAAKLAGTARAFHDDPPLTTGYVPFPAAVIESEALAKQFVDRPKSFATTMGASLESLITCPPKAHAAFVRGEAFVAEATAGVSQWSEASILRLHGVAQSHFGTDYHVEFIPFGLRFREQIEFPTISSGGCASDVTATGSGTITFADGDGDVDG